MIDPCRPHAISYGNKICINGVLYYRAGIGRMSSEATMLVRFDFSSEKLFFMEIIESFSRALHTAATLINYNGKLGSLLSEGPRFVTGETRSFELWVLEDVEKHEWSKHTYIHIASFVETYGWRRPFKLCWSDSDQ
ncbi:F-box protein [Cardamine amara subsp. amara]|uniref:F-box protein n=1 Tax=Cardamine amara subsp. amara TaxID=228776 RepID=A0ABD1BVG1_CARAN